MTTFYKATRLDGRDFRTGTIDYAGALATGTLVRHPHAGPMVPNDPITYLSVSVEPAETLIGGAWPCRLFRVEPVGEIMDRLAASLYKRACKALRVLDELPGWQALGPNGVRVAAVLDRAGRLTGHEIDKLASARRAASLTVSSSATFGVAWLSARSATRNAAIYGIRRAAWGVALDTAQNGARSAAAAEVVRDLITEEQYQALAGPWLSVIG